MTQNMPALFKAYQNAYEVYGVGYGISDEALFVDWIKHNSITANLVYNEYKELRAADYQPPFYLTQARQRALTARMIERGLLDD